ncbi:MAG TPA: helix-turn-helix transcriptional regulator, partial [Saprospiraceae bacterium]|nr:helix-turn-helix transcriptional regulator [Saprospiraceae bacterium]
MAALMTWFSHQPVPDTTRFYTKLAAMQAEFQQQDASDLAHQVWYLHFFHSTGNYYLVHQKGIDILEEVIAYAHRHGWSPQEAQLLVHEGLVMINQGKTISAYGNLIRGYEMMRDLGFDKVPDAKNFLLQLGNAYMLIADYKSAIHYLREARSIPLVIPSDGLELSLMNTTGLCFQRMAEYDSAVVFYAKANEVATRMNNDFWKSFTNGNLGYAYFKKGEDDKALPLIETDFDTSLHYHEIGSALNAALSLASIYLKKGNRAKAEQYIQFSIAHVDRTSDHSMAVFYDNLFQYSKLKGEYEKATQYVDSFRHYNDRYLASEDKSIVEKAQLQLEMVNHASELHSLEATRKRQVLIRNGLLAILALTGIIASLLINRHTLRRKKELQMARLELESYTNTIREKNELIDSFSDEIEKMRASDSHHLDERTNQLQELMHASILTEEDWNHFRRMFDTVHPGFFVRLKEKMSDLTPAETRLLALTKLQLAPREMASMLGISYEAIKKARQRLRRKIDLPEEGSLDELVNLI